MTPGAGKVDAKKVGFFYDDVFLGHETPRGHPERKERLEAIVSKLRDSDVWDKLIHIKPTRASAGDIGLIHERGYVERMTAFRGYADPDTYVSGGSIEAALYAAGAVIGAIDASREGRIERAFCAVRPPGHHAEADRAMGFCIFNNIAIGAAHARRAGYNRVFIVDFDVHHGNGTQHVFEEEENVFYMSTHQYPHYPGTGAASEKGRGNVLNIPMPAGSGDAEYSDAYGGALTAAVRGFKPDIILVSAGYDIHINDPLSDIRVTGDGINNIVSGIVSASGGAPLVFSLEGGYDLEALSDSVLSTLRRLLKG